MATCCQFYNTPKVIIEAKCHIKGNISTPFFSIAPNWKLSKVQEADAGIIYTWLLDGYMRHLV